MRKQGDDFILESSQWVPRPPAELFPFFANEANLELLTPPWLSFKVLGKSTPSMETGTLIDYRLKLYGLPFRWRTRIEAWDDGRGFVDTQLKGPYAKWHHTHTFAEENGGTRMTDVVRYRLPMGKLGNLLAGWKVHRDVRGIFEFRRAEIARRFGSEP